MATTQLCDLVIALTFLEVSNLMTKVEISWYEIIGEKWASEAFMVEALSRSLSVRCPRVHAKFRKTTTPR